MTGSQTMTEERLSGEARDRANNRRRLWLFSGLALAGGIVGFTFAMFEAKNDVALGGTIPPAVAIALAVVTFVAMVWGTVAYKRRIDEVVLRDNIYAGAWGAFTIFVGYPVWFLLWKGGLLPEPSHMAMYAILYVVTCAVYLFRKYR
jgi:FtsH-binding integral membrane protein